MIALALLNGIRSYANSLRGIPTTGKPVMDDTNDVLSVGIDLGTSRSSVSASNGERHVIDSYAGWPVDLVARKVVKKAMLFGREALENRSMLDLRRPLEHGLIKEGSEKDEEAVRRSCAT